MYFITYCCYSIEYSVVFDILVAAKENKVFLDIEGNLLNISISLFLKFVFHINEDLNQCNSFIMYICDGFLMVAFRQ